MLRDVPNYDVVRWRGRTASACVLIPVINEGERIGRLLSRMHALNIAGVADIIVVDGGSKDGSLEAERLDAANVAGLLVKRGPGKLSAQLRCAYDFVLAQGYDEIITIDGNDKDDPDPIPDFIAAIRDGFDFVQASRFVPGGVEENTPAKRRFAVRYIHAPALSIASGFHWTDTTQGFRAYSRRLLTDERVDIFRPEFTTYELLAYLNYRAPRLGYRCTEMPTARRYPADEAVPTKIDFRGEIGLLMTLARTCLGGFNPSPAAAASVMADRDPRWTSPGERLLGRLVTMLLLVAALAVVIVTSFHVPLNEPLIDLFQEGEFLAPRFYLQPGGVLPLLIHGQMDYLPNQLAVALCASDGVVACTRVVNASLNALTGLFFLTCAAAAWHRGGRGRAYALLLAMVLIVMVNGPRSSGVALDQGAPALRDPGLFAMLCLLMLAERHPGRGRQMAVLLAGFTAGIAVFFSYNRGVTGIVALAAALAVALVAWRDRLAVLLGGVGLAAGAVIVTLADPAMARQHLANIAYWGNHPEIWAMAPSNALILRGVTFYLPVLLVLAVAVVGGVIHWRGRRRNAELPVLAFLTVVTTIIVQQSVSRYDTIHLSFALPWLFLLLLLIANWLPRSGRGVDSRDILIVGAIAWLVFFDVAREGSSLTEMARNFVPNVRMMASGLPKDRALIDDDLRRTVDLIVRQGDRCAYAANNAAAIYHLTGKPPCASVMVPVYAAVDLEMAIIDQLRRADPGVIVWNSDDWFTHIDYRTVETQTPRLATWIKASYPYTIQYGDITIRSKTPQIATTR